MRLHRLVVLSALLWRSIASSISQGKQLSPRHDQAPAQAQAIFSNPHTSEHGIPTIHESAIMARRILRLESIGTLSTVFPSKSKSNGDNDTVGSWETRPSDVSGSPIGLMEYFADCERGPAHAGNPTLLQVDIATPYKNFAAGSNITLSLRWHPTRPGRWSAAALPRFALVGYLKELTPQEIWEGNVVGCFTGYHPDSTIWQPGNDIHTSRWVKFIVREVYWFGGFGDRARIGWLPIDEWKGVTEEEIKECRLPGEEGWDGNMW